MATRKQLGWPLPIPEDIRNHLSYDHKTGNFRWVNCKRTSLRTDTAGSLHPNGYRKICFDKKAYHAHRLAWFLHYGEQPPTMIDHADGRKDNNRIANLRATQGSLNGANARPRRQERRYKGAYLKPHGRWQATIKVNYRSVSLGHFDTEEQAARAYDVAAKKLFGEFARLNFTEQS